MTVKLFVIQALCINLFYSTQGPIPEILVRKYWELWDLKKLHFFNPPNLKFKDTIYLIKVLKILSLCMVSIQESCKGPFKYYVSKEVGGWGWPNADVCWQGGWMGVTKCWCEKKIRDVILLPKLFWLTVRKYCSTDREKLFAKFLRSLEQFIQAVKGQNNFW